jgi:hypothetical protein
MCESIRDKFQAILKFGMVLQHLLQDIQKLLHNTAYLPPDEGDLVHPLHPLLTQ